MCLVQVKCEQTVKIVCLQISMKVSLWHLFSLRSGSGKHLHSDTVCGCWHCQCLILTSRPSQVQSRGQLQSEVWSQDFCQYGSTTNCLWATCSLRATYWAAFPNTTMQYNEQIVSSGRERMCTYLHVAAKASQETQSERRAKIYDSNYLWM